MPNCLDRECVNGIVMRKINDAIVQKICLNCQKIEKDLEESDDYIVYHENGRVVGYEIVDEEIEKHKNLLELELQTIKNSPEYK